MLNLYEAMYIVDPDRSEQEVEALTRQVRSEIAEKGGEVVDLQHLGKKRLAYPIKKAKDGFYFLLYFRLAPDRISELRAGYRLNDSILRFLILKKKERELQFAGKATSGGRACPTATARESTEAEIDDASDAALDDTSQMRESNGAVGATEKE